MNILHVDELLGRRIVVESMGETDVEALVHAGHKYKRRNARGKVAQRRRTRGIKNMIHSAAVTDSHGQL